MPIANKHSATLFIRKSLNTRIYVFLHIVIGIFSKLTFLGITVVNVTS